MHQGHGHLHVIWGFWIPLSLIALDRWVAEPSWRRVAALGAIVVLQALGSWYQAVMIVIADAIFMLWLLLIERVVPRPRLATLALQAAIVEVVALAIVAPFARHYGVLAAVGPDEAVR